MRKNSIYTCSKLFSLLFLFFGDCTLVEGDFPPFLDILIELLFKNYRIQEDKDSMNCNIAIWRGDTRAGKISEKFSLRSFQNQAIRVRQEEK